MHLYRLLALCAIFATRVLAWTPFQSDVTQSAIPQNQTPVDHLLPSTREVFAHKLPFPYLAAFQAMPSFSDAYMVYVAKANTGDEYFVTAVMVGAKPSPPPPRAVQIPKDVAADVYWVWTNTLLDVGYTRTPTIGLDGTTYYFSTWIRGLGDLNGQTWEPSGNLPPKMLADAGDFLFRYATDEKAQPKDCRSYFAALKKRLAAYYSLRAPERATNR